MCSDKMSANDFLLYSQYHQRRKLPPAADDNKYRDPQLESEGLGIHSRKWNMSIKFLSSELRESMAEEGERV